MLGVNSVNTPLTGEFAVRFCEQLKQAIAIRKANIKNV